MLVLFSSVIEGINSEHHEAMQQALRDHLNAHVIWGGSHDVKVMILIDVSYDTYRARYTGSMDDVMQFDEFELTRKVMTKTTQRNYSTVVIDANGTPEETVQLFRDTFWLFKRTN